MSDKDPLTITFQDFTTGDEPVVIETTQYRMECGSHGLVIWTGEAICDPDKGGCGKVWRLDGNPARQPPESCGSNCTCGKPLHVEDEKCTAMPICPTCFVQKWHEQQEASC